MKILIVQLARFGDIYMSWPAMRAVRRQYPNSEIHLLTRSRFFAAAENLDVINQHWKLDNIHLLSPCLNDEFEESLGRIQNFVESLKQVDFNWIINLTFSPVSSYLVHAIEGSNTKVSGFTRFDDGFLRIADPASGYFYAQVGIHRFNRVHLTDIFSAVISINYHPEDWRAPVLANRNIELPESIISIHIGASEKGKRLHGYQWSQLIRELMRKGLKQRIVLLGSAEEFAIGEEIELTLNRNNHEVTNLIGQTKLRDLFYILSCSDLFIGCDSALLHIAALTDTSVYHFSVGQVNFWETGPKSSVAYIERLISQTQFQSHRSAQNILDIINSNPPINMIHRQDGMESYAAPQTPREHFLWGFIKALYFDEPFPIADDYSFYEASLRIRETAEVVMKSIEDFKLSAIDSLSRVLGTSDEILHKIGKINPDLQPLLWWFESQKVMIGPGEFETIKSQTYDLYSTLSKIVSLYIPEDEIKGQGGEK